MGCTGPKKNREPPRSIPTPPPMRPSIFRRRNIGFIFQNYNLVPILNVYENIVLPVELDGDTVDQKFLDEIVHLLGLEDKLKNGEAI